MKAKMNLKFKDAITKRYVNIKKAIVEKIKVIKVLSFVDRNTGKRKEQQTGRAKVFEKEPSLAENLSVKFRGENGRFVSKKKRHRHQSIRAEVWNGDVRVYVGEYELLDTLREMKLVENIAKDKAETKYLPPERTVYGGVDRDTLDVALDAYKASPNSAKTFYIWQLIYSKVHDAEKASKIYKDVKEDFLEMDLSEMQKAAKEFKNE